MDPDDDIRPNIGLLEEEASISVISLGKNKGDQNEYERPRPRPASIAIPVGLPNSEENAATEWEQEKCQPNSKALFFPAIEEECVKFQVMCAHTEVSDADKFVVYTIDVERGEDSRPALIERRYSDFLALYSSLKQSHPALLGRIRFPRKVIMGNFKGGVIEERSNFFENFLSYIFSKDVLKCSAPFKAFLYRREMQESSHHLLHSEFEDAVPTLENLFWLLNKLHGDRDQLLRTLLQLIVSLHAVGNYELTHDYALLALPRFETRSIDGNCLAKELYVPFLQFCVRLWWLLGRNRSVFEEKLRKAKEDGQKTEGLPDLLDSLRDEITVPKLFS